VAEELGETRRLLGSCSKKRFRGRLEVRERLRKLTGRFSTVEKEDLTFEGDLMEAIEGLLSDIDVDFVEFHETRKTWMLKALKNVPD
jgi:hypothetical protein